MTGPEASGAIKIKSNIMIASAIKKDRKRVIAIKLVVRFGLPSLHSFAAMLRADDSWMDVSDETCVFESISPPAHQPSPAQPRTKPTRQPSPAEFSVS